MMCDFELGKFTYLDKYEPVIPPNCATSQIINIPGIIVDITDEPEIIEPKIEAKVDQSDVLFEGVKRKNGFCLESPTKKLATSESFDSCKQIDNIQLRVTKHPDKQISEKLKKMVNNKQTYENEPSTQTIETYSNSQPTETNSNSQTNITRTITTTSTISTTKYKQYNDPVNLVAEGEGHPCKWFMCHIQMDFTSPETLFDHVQGEHVEPCQGQEVFMCQWNGCKVFDVPSTSNNWYKSHVLSHTKGKMFRCLFDGCPASFRTREGLSHHMEMQNSHSSPSEKKVNKNKNKIKPKPKSKSTPSGLTQVARSRQNDDTFMPQRRSQRLHHTPSFKRYFTDIDPEEETTVPKSQGRTQDSFQRFIQSRAEVMTKSDLVQSNHSSHETSDFSHLLERLSENFHDKPISFQVLGRRFFEDTESKFEYLFGISKTLADWFTTDTFSTLFHTSLNLNTADSEPNQSILRMRSNKRK